MKAILIIAICVAFFLGMLFGISILAVLSHARENCDEFND